MSISVFSPDAWKTNRKSIRPGLPDLIAAGAIVAVLLLATLGTDVDWIRDYPAEWNVPFNVAINAVVLPAVAVLQPLTGLISTVLDAMLRQIVAGLLSLPWPAVLSALSLLALGLGGVRLMLFVSGALAYMLAAGFWNQGITTFGILTMAVPMAVVIGFLVGLAVHVTGRGRRPLEVLLDIMQTFPPFAYIIPLLLLFGFGPVGGLVSTVVFAVPPMVRCTLLGFERVPPEVVEAAHISGCKPLQRLFWAEIPAAKPDLLIGINQATMAALSMIVMAAIIGGFEDIGWVVMNAVRRADFGNGLLSGIVLTLMAMMIDRLTRAASTSDNLRRTSRIFFWLAGVALLGGAVFGLADAGMAKAINASTALIDPRDVNTWLLSLVQPLGPVLDAIKNNAMYFVLLPLRLGLSDAITPRSWGFQWTTTMSSAYWMLVAALGCFAAFRNRSVNSAAAIVICATLLFTGFSDFPWFAMILSLGWLGWRCGGWRIALLAGCSTAFIVLAGLYEPFVKSLYLCLIAGLLCFLTGGAIGILAARNNTFSAIIRPITETLQTLPQFVFLIPALMFFKVGEFTGLLAIMMYAIVPPIRYVEHGLRTLSSELKEVAVQTGCTRMQALFLAELPAAKPAILLALNQTIMAVLSMLPVAAMVGTTELGQAVYIALGRADAGAGITAGLTLSLIALVSERMLRAQIGPK